MSDGDGQATAPDQYFSERPRSRSARRELRFLYRGELLTFAVDAGVFAAHGLDPGTALLIECLQPKRTDRVLDLGCGWGPVGVAAGKAAPDGRIVLTEVNRRAARLAEENLARNGIRHAEVRVGRLFEPVEGEQFDLIATNPPYRAGRELVLDLLRQYPAHLAPGGHLLVVGKGSQGIRFYQSWLGEKTGAEVEVVGRGSGYRVLDCRPAPRRNSVRARRGPSAAEALKSGSRLGGRPRPEGSNRRPVPAFGIGEPGEPNQGE